MGNSITQGNAGSNYPLFLDSLLANDFSVNNYGYSGATTQKRFSISYWNQAVFRQALAFDPHYVVIELSTNDCKYARWDTALFHADYAALVDTFLSLPSNKDVFLCRPVPIYNETLYSHIDSILDSGAIPIIERVAREKSLPLIDLHSAFQDSLRLYADGIHPTADGYRFMAKVIYEAIIGKAGIPRRNPAKAVPARALACRVYDLRGRRVQGSIGYDSNLPAGIYFLVYRSGASRMVRRAVVLR